MFVELRDLPRLLCGFSLCLAFGTASPGAARATAVSVTLDQVLAAVLRHNPEIAASTQQRAVAAAETRIARAYPNPEIDVGGGRWRPRLGAPGAGSMEALSVAQAIELPSVREARVRAAGFGEAAVGAAALVVRNEVGYEARAAFFQLLRRQEEARLAADNVGLLSDILARVRSRVDVGEAPRFELVRAEAELLSARTLADAARLKVEEARALLRRLSGNTLPAQFEAKGALPVAGQPLPLAVLQERVIGAHPALRALAAEHDRARARLDQERALRAPQPTLRLSETRDPEVRQTLAGISLPLPLWNRREGQIAQAQANIDLALVQIEAQRVQLLRELDAAYSRLGIAQRQIETFEGGLLSSAEAALRVAESAWRFGERSFLEVLDAQRTLRGVRNDYNQARFDRHAAWMDIERLLALDPFRQE
jgi:cobalt-zinc-cadmium efflux system outer membrane protein